MLISGGRPLRAGDDKNGLVITSDTTPGVVHVTGIGFWTPFVMDTHFSQLRLAIAPFRKENHPVKMIVDLRTSSVQSFETTERMKVGAASVTEPGDRMAIIVDSSLAKMQMRRTIGDAQHEFFVSHNAAVQWVLAY
ncbi:MAG: hypothetical protein M3Y22_14820 [Pseudomonadota bacterium]|nr:hypothetical protein [Pseudomonadota bacterium]